jgi:hypothetical protein
MDWLKDFFNKNTIFSLFVSTGIGGLSFFANLFVALSDGKIDTTEFHQLMSSANGLQTIILLLVMFALNKNDKK